MVTMRAVCLMVLLAVPAWAQAPVAAPAPAHMRLGRLIGVFDALSGVPLDDVMVANTLNGLSARTTATGTLSLFFVDTAGTLLRFQKMGYQPLLLPVANSDRDTIPLTILMEPASQRLAPVITTAKAVRGPADTVRKLELSGFYDRRASNGAPTSAFQTAEKIEGFTLLSEVSTLTGRSVCLNNLYIDGNKISTLDPSLELKKRAGVGPRNLRANPVDQLLDSKGVLAIEMYRSSEVPPEYNATRPPGAPDCGATLIWTK